MVYVWLGLFVIMVIVEFATSELISVWFAGGGFSPYCIAHSWHAILVRNHRLQRELSAPSFSHSTFS